SEVLMAIKSAVQAINATGLPRPIQIVPFYDRTTLIDTTLRTVFRNLHEGALLVGIVLFLFLGDLRAAGIVAVVIPLALHGAFIGSLLFSLTLVPLLCLYLLGRSRAQEENVLVRWCTRAYRPVLRRALDHRRAVLAAAVAALLASLAVAPRLGTEFLPELNEGSIWINIMLPPGISVTEASRQLKRIRTVLRRFPEVQKVMSKAGRPEDGTDPKMVNMAELLVDVKPASEWRPRLSKEALIDQMNSALQAIPGIE